LPFLPHLQFSGPTLLPESVYFGLRHSFAPFRFFLYSLPPRPSQLPAEWRIKLFSQLSVPHASSGLSLTWAVLVPLFGAKPFPSTQIPRIFWIFPSAGYSSRDLFSRLLVKKLMVRVLSFTSGPFLFFVRRALLSWGPERSPSHHCCRCPIVLLIFFLNPLPYRLDTAFGPSLILSVSLVLLGAAFFFFPLYLLGQFCRETPTVVQVFHLLRGAHTTSATSTTPLESIRPPPPLVFLCCIFFF